MQRQKYLIAGVMALAVAAVAGIAIVATPGELCAAPAKKPTVSFAEDILPLLKWRCSSCHAAGGAGTEKSGLDLTSYEGVMKGTKFGKMVVAGDPESSNLMLLLDWRASPALRMPHGQKQLSKCDRDSIRTWIREGALNN